MELKRLRDLREDHDLSQQRVAEQLNMYRSVYRRYEVGERETPAWVVVKLAEFYKVSSDYLLGLTDDPTPPPPPKRR
ncbi:MAG: helix-turn-helix transcriptional regulator [Oscillibacter sp.]|nr:helix-turn-helix transcriptional regulator [Oscillibacter sp.]